MTRLLIPATAVVGLLAPGMADGQSTEISRVTHEQYKRTARLADRPSAATHDEQGQPYVVGIGLYGAEEPSVYPDERWLNIACISEPGRSYVGSNLSLLYVDVLLYANGELVWDTTTGDRERGICDINRGVDTTFVEVPRTLEFDAWDVFVTVAEMGDMGVAYTKTVFPPHIYDVE